jgi:hypothetical protein
LEEVSVHAGREVLMEVHDNNALIVGKPQGILGHLLLVWTAEFPW